MKTPILLVLAAAVLAWAASAAVNKYDDLVAKGYRWATVDGPYACVSKGDVRLMASNPGDSVELKMIEQVKAYYLTPGTIVQVTEEDPHLGMVKIRLAGITVDLWTLSKFLSKHPLKDTYGVIETPETSGLIPTSSPVINAGPTPIPNFSPIAPLMSAPGESPVPNGSPASSATPASSASPAESASPSPVSGQ